MLQEIYQKFGCYFEKTKSYTLAGREGMERICRAMSDLRSKTPQQFGAHKVKVFEDYSNGTTKDFEFNLSFAAQLPQCNVLRFTFSEGGNSSVIVRPSGTEPKLKLYISASAKKPEEAEQKANELLSAANAFIEESIKS
ncbi:phosphomannomutase [Clostridium sp. CAG:138]|nr:phosphomannomutase [Clostridium sp. CAG:138]